MELQRHLGVKPSLASGQKGYQIPLKLERRFIISSETHPVTLRSCALVNVRHTTGRRRRILNEFEPRKRVHLHCLASGGFRPWDAALTTTIVMLEPGESASLLIPPSWFGQLWARTLCSYGLIGQFNCLTDDCGTGSEECASAQTVSTVTVAKDIEVI
ncbi:hypothetical protein RJ639_042001 [Escallonia herrerae]|uniref:Uncharacterized protein n=1 Tax=Escallonia herrerae TaxID=1293975 RepID=A0AA88WHJ0_9ASTE|nr:hypothetical protein RJ639_042001 [Escallonia herrerae]